MDPGKQDARYIADLLYFCQWVFFFLFVLGGALTLAPKGDLGLLFLSVVLLIANNEIRSYYDRRANGG